ncbi:MAG: hypothetical protein J1E39_03675 [Eubacterium sp.]|nr:hypothetical protein [Eubacterium sp.]
MKTYIYPKNLKAKTTVWFWRVRDLIVIVFGIILSVIILINVQSFVPLVFVTAFALITIDTEGRTVFSYLSAASKQIFHQQKFNWK